MVRRLFHIYYNLDRSVSKSVDNFYEKMKILLSIWLTIWYLNISTSANNEKALIFNREKNSLIVAPKNLQNVDYKTWVSACPAKDKDENEFGDTFSFYNAALFVDKIYNGGNSNDFHNDTCGGKYKLSMAWFKDTIEFGYEIFLKKSETVANKFDECIYDDYESLRYFLDIESSSWMDYLRKLYAESKKEKTELVFKGKEKMEFIWIPSFKVWFKANRFRKIEYQIRKNNVNAKLSCNDYNMGNELFYGADVDELYSEESQQKAFEGLKIPLGDEDYSCEPTYDCLTKWLLIPADQFQFNSSSPISCSNIVTVPIWKNTIELILQKLDEYLYTLSRVSGEPLRIVSGVRGVLQMPRRWSFKSLLNNLVYFWHEKFTIRAPRVIFKIVKFKTDKCELRDDPFCWYGVIIIIHNSPYYSEKSPICDDVTEELGWSEIKYEKLSSQEQKPSKFIYVCKINRKSIEAVGLTYDQNLIIGELSLVEFPDWSGGEFAKKDMKKEVFDELVRLSEGAEIEVKDEVIERPSIHDYDFDLVNDKDDEEINELFDNSEDGSEEEEEEEDDKKE